MEKTIERLASEGWPVQSILEYLCNVYGVHSVREWSWNSYMSEEEAVAEVLRKMDYSV